MKAYLYIVLTTALLSACSNTSTSGFWSAKNNNAAAGVTQTFRW